jgi:excinuclease ABC subunit C
VLEAFIAQHYLGAALPHTLVTSHPVGKPLIDALGEQAGSRLQAVHQPREHRRAWLDMAQKNAEIALARLLAEEGSQQARTRALAEALGLPDDNLDELRIECFDISHTAGESTQASCVVFEGAQDAEQPVPALQHRGHHPGDDYAAMRQVLLRRYGKIAEALRAERKARPSAPGETRCGAFGRPQAPPSPPRHPRDHACPIWC